jgi:hypothetical protein
VRETQDDLAAVRGQIASPLRDVGIELARGDPV